MPFKSRNRCTNHPTPLTLEQRVEQLFVRAPDREVLTIQNNETGQTGKVRFAVHDAVVDRQRPHSFHARREAARGIVAAVLYGYNFRPPDTLVVGHYSDARPTVNFQPYAIGVATLRPDTSRFEGQVGIRNDTALRGTLSPNQIKTSLETSQNDNARDPRFDAAAGEYFYTKLGGERPLDLENWFLVEGARLIVAQLVSAPNA